MASYVDPLLKFTSLPSYGNDAIIDFDNVTGNQVNFPCDGTGWWQVDLGGVYQINRCV